MKCFNKIHEMIEPAGWVEARRQKFMRQLFPDAVILGNGNIAVQLPCQSPPFA